MADVSSFYPHPWCKRIGAYLPDALFSKPVAELDARWQSVQRTLSASSPQAPDALDEASHACVSLLEYNTKDMRVLCALLTCQLTRCTPDAFSVVLMLLVTWLDCAWQRASPASTQQKVQLLLRLVDDIDTASHTVAPQCSPLQRQQTARQLDAVALWLSELLPEHPHMLSPLMARFASSQSATPQVTYPRCEENLCTAPSSLASPVPSQTPETAQWLAMATLLITRTPDAPVGYLLRRQAMWGTLAVGDVLAEGRTLIPSPEAALIRTGVAGLNNPCIETLIAFDALLADAPYWFCGQRLSAAIATVLGLNQVSRAIHEAATTCLTRHPELIGLCFLDGTPFISAHTHAWLALPSSLPTYGPASSKDDPHATSLLSRDDFYALVTQADLCRERGLCQEAEHRYRALLHHARARGLDTWERALFSYMASNLMACMAINSPFTPPDITSDDDGGDLAV